MVTSLGDTPYSLAAAAYAPTLICPGMPEHVLVELGNGLAHIAGLAEADLLTGGARAACVGVGLEAAGAFLFLANDTRVAP